MTGTADRLWHRYGGDTDLLTQDAPEFDINAATGTKWVETYSADAFICGETYAY